MIKIVVRNCDDLEVKREFNNGEEFMKIMNGDGLEDGLMLDDEILSLEIDGENITYMNYVDDLYNSYDDDYSF